MLTRHELADLSRTHEKDLVLSVYVARDGVDPARRTGWRLRLDGALATLRDGIESESPDDLPAFERAAEAVQAALASFGRVLPGEGWAGFANASGLVHSEAVPFAPPDVVRWRQGVYTAPYVRMFKSARPVVLALMDVWHTRLFRWQDAELVSTSAVESERPSVDASDLGAFKRGSARSGMRGEPRADYAQRVFEEASRRQRKSVVEAILSTAGDVGGVVLAGMPKTVAAVGRDLEEKLEGRLVHAHGLTLESTDAEIAAAVAAAASELTHARQARLLDACKQLPERGSLGWNRTYRALAAGAVDTLLLSRNLIETEPDDAERLVRLALAQGAEVEEVGEEAGTRLWAEADGVAARLRFRIAA